MKIVVLGAGYVGLVTGACFAELGNHVTCIDVNADKIKQLREGKLPIYEPGLDVMVSDNVAMGRLFFAESFSQLSAHPDVIFIAVGTPSDDDGAAEVKYVLSAADAIGNYLSMPTVVVDKSTVPVGMAEKVTERIEAGLAARQQSVFFEVVSNPEFLREGAAIDDFMKPDRVVVGLSSQHAKEVMMNLYLPILRSTERLYMMNVKDAEMTKYAANAMLATRISFMNEMSLLCEKMGVDIEHVRVGIGSDRRIGPAFLNTGCGYGGSCFPKDVRALTKMAEMHGVTPLLLHAVEERNRLQKERLLNKAIELFGEDFTGLTFAVWGLAFKPGTDDMREAPSLIFINDALRRGAQIFAFDPVVNDAGHLHDAFISGHHHFSFADDPYDAVKQADVLVLITEWKLFSYPDLEKIKSSMKRPIIIDGRNHLDMKSVIEAGFSYTGMGRGAQNPCFLVDECVN